MSPLPAKLRPMDFSAPGSPSPLPAHLPPIHSAHTGMHSSICHPRSSSPESLKTGGKRSRPRTRVGVACKRGHPTGPAASVLEAPAASPDIGVWPTSPRLPRHAPNPRSGRTSQQLFPIPSPNEARTPAGFQGLGQMPTPLPVCSGALLLLPAPTAAQHGVNKCSVNNLLNE